MKLMYCQAKGIREMRSLDKGESVFSFSPYGTEKIRIFSSFLPEKNYEV